MQKSKRDQILSQRDQLLIRTTQLANDYLDEVANRPVALPVEFEQLLKDVRGHGLREEGDDPAQIIEQLAKLGNQATVATAGPRYFGFVVGGALPVALAADWLTTTWDQNAAFYAHSPMAAAVEQTAGDWLIDLFGLVKGTSFGFVTGG